MVWTQVFRFLDDLKSQVGAARDPHHLADLMWTWEEYEMTRTRQDVLLFAKDMIEDVAISAHLTRAIATNAAWLRDSAGLWCRLHSLVEEGEIDAASLSDPFQSRQRLARAVETALSVFERDGGGHAHHGGLARDFFLILIYFYPLCFLHKYHMRLSGNT
jgi:hypothetical protein